MNQQEGEIRIYVACLASYNAGVLHGAWINADQDEEAISAAIAVMLKASPVRGAEEYAIHDYEGFEGANIEEYSSIETVSAIAVFIGEHGELGGKVLEYFGDLDEAHNVLEERYYGVYNSIAGYAEELIEQTTEIPESLRFYIDYEKMGRDLEINDLITFETGFEQVHVFWSH